MDKKLIKEIKELTLRLCDLESDKYFFNIAVIRGVVSKEEREYSIKKINKEIDETIKELKRLTTC